MRAERRGCRLRAHAGGGWTRGPHAAVARGPPARAQDDAAVARVLTLGCGPEDLAAAARDWRAGDDAAAARGPTRRDRCGCRPSRADAQRGTRPLPEDSSAGDHAAGRRCCRPRTGVRGTTLLPPEGRRAGIVAAVARAGPTRREGRARCRRTHPRETTQLPPEGRLAGRASPSAEGLTRSERPGDRPGLVREERRGCRLEADAQRATRDRRLTGAPAFGRLRADAPRSV